MHCTQRREPGSLAAGQVSERVNELLDPVPGAAWVFQGDFMTSGSGNVDIWFPVQSQGYLRVWVWSDTGGGLLYILTSTLGKETQQTLEDEQETKKATCLQQETHPQASWRLWPCSPSVPFCQCAGPWAVRTDSHTSPSGVCAFSVFNKLSPVITSSGTRGCRGPWCRHGCWRCIDWTCRWSTDCTCRCLLFLLWVRLQLFLRLLSIRFILLFLGILWVLIVRVYRILFLRVLRVQFFLWLVCLLFLFLFLLILILIGVSQHWGYAKNNNSRQNLFIVNVKVSNKKLKKV